jgi:LAS superfamily LD-carboxypeptidase LdcB
MLNPLELTGRSRTHVVQRDDLGGAFHADVIGPYLALHAAAARDGLDIGIVSAFRDFDAQVRIWNLKYRGKRPLYGRDGTPRSRDALPAGELIDAILCWSALPGASRHHWGSEIDVIDRAAVPEGYRIRLLPEEAAPGGVFFRLHQWLDLHMGEFGFYRPYRTDRGGVAAEPWHLSYAAVAAVAQSALTPEAVADALRSADLLGRDEILARLPLIFSRYVANVDLPDGAVSGTAA